MNTDKYVSLLGEQITRLEDKIDSTRNELQLMKEVLNNGIVSATLENTKSVKELAKRLKEVETQVRIEDSYTQGKVKTWQLLLGALILGGNFLLGVITVLGHLGLL